MCTNQALPQYEITDDTIVISKTHQDKFDLMSGLYSNLTMEIVDLVDDEVKSVENLIICLNRLFPAMKSSFDKNESVRNVMEKLIEKRCNIINVAALELVAVRHYKIEEAEKKIEEYMRELKQFCSQKIVNIVDRNLLNCVVLRFETIKFHLEWSPEEYTINEIELLLKKAFVDDYLRQRVIVIKVTTGNSITIICYAPHHLMDILLVEAEGNIDQLKGMGLIHLTIGYYTVYDNTNDKVIEMLTNEIEDTVKEVRKTICQLTDILDNKEENMKLLQGKLVLFKSEKEAENDNESSSDIQIPKRKRLELKGALKEKQLKTDNEELKPQMKEKDILIAQHKRSIVVLKEEVSELREKNKHKSIKLQHKNKTIANLSNELKSLKESNKLIDDDKSCTQLVHDNDYQFTLDDVSKLMVILQPVEDDWYQLGRHLDMEESTLRDAKQTDIPLEYLLQRWCSEGGTLMKLEKALTDIGRTDVISGLHQLKAVMKMDVDVHMTPSIGSIYCQNGLVPILAEDGDDPKPTPSDTSVEEEEENEEEQEEIESEELDEVQSNESTQESQPINQPSLTDEEEEKHIDSDGVMSTDVLYAGVVYYEIKGSEDLVTFATAKNLNHGALLQYINDCHPNAVIDVNITYQFKPGCEYIELIIDALQEYSTDGWIIRSLQKPCRLYKKHIDLFGSQDYPIPPKCLISVYSINRPDIVPVLHYGIPLEGVDHPVTIFIHRALRTINTGTPLEATPPSSSPTPSTNKDEVDMKQLIRIIDGVLVSYHATLNGLPSRPLRSLADHLYASHLITDDVRDEPTMGGCINEFRASLNFFRNKSLVQHQCSKFLKCFIAVGGSYFTAAIALREDFIEAVNNELNCNFNIDLS